MAFSTEYMDKAAPEVTTSSSTLFNMSLLIKRTASSGMRPVCGFNSAMSVYICELAKVYRDEL